MRRIAGFSLVEVLVALAIGSAIVVGGFQLLRNSGELTRANSLIIGDDIAFLSMSLMLQADLEAAEPIQPGAMRFRVIVRGNGTDIVLARNGVTEDRLPGLLSVTWTFGPGGVSRLVNLANFSSGGPRILLKDPVSLAPEPERSRETGLSVWKVETTGHVRELWLPVQ